MTTPDHLREPATPPSAPAIGYYGPEPVAGESIAPVIARMLLLRSQGYRCLDCRILLWSNDAPETYPYARTPGTREATIDHVIPRCGGGTDTWGNYEVICSPCNTRRYNAWRRENPVTASLAAVAS